MTSRMGQLRDRVTIQQNCAADHDPEEDFTGTPLLADWPCRIVAVSGNESFQGRLIDAEVSYIVEGWYVAGVLPDMRCLVTAGLPMESQLNIKFVHPIPPTDGKPALLQLHCTELVNV